MNYLYSPFLKMPFLLGMLVISFVGCSEDDENTNDELQQRLDEQIIEVEDYINENSIDADAVNGYYLETITENADGAAPVANGAVGIYYELLTLDGQLIERLEESPENAPLKFPFIPERVFMPGALYDVISNMHEGEEVRAYLPFNTAYGGFSLPNSLPAYSAVIMSVKLAEVLNAAEQKLVEDATIKTYLAENGFTTADSLEGGVYYIETQAGEAPAVEANSIVALRYTGTFLDGTEFDSNAESANPYSVEIGQEEVIQGFETAIREMSMNEQGTAIIPSDQAYGSGYITIPYDFMEDLAVQGYISGAFIDMKPYSILRFDLEVEDIN